MQEFENYQAYNKLKEEEKEKVNLKVNQNYEDQVNKINPISEAKKNNPYINNNNNSNFNNTPNHNINNNNNKKDGIEINKFFYNNQNQINEVISNENSFSQESIQSDRIVSRLRNNEKIKENFYKLKKKRFSLNMIEMIKFNCCLKSEKT